MSYGLDFLSRKSEDVSAEEMLRWSEKYHWFRRSGSDDGPALWYENEDTGVYFTIEPAGREECELEEMGIPAGLHDSGVVGNINLFRPSFFIHEAAPVFVDFAKSFALVISNPQEDEAYPREADAQALIESWTEHNAKASKVALSHVPSHPRMAREKSMAMWRYLYQKRDLQHRSGDGVIVPEIAAMAPKDGGEVLRGMVWAAGVATVFPECDVVVLVKQRKRMLGLGTRTDAGWVAAEALLPQLEPYLETRTEPVPHRVLMPERCDDVMDLFENTPVRPITGSFAGVPLDQFVDAE